MLQISRYRETNRKYNKDYTTGMAAMAGDRLGGRPDGTEQGDNERGTRAGAADRHTTHWNYHPTLEQYGMPPEGMFPEISPEEMSAFAKAFATDCDKRHGIIWQNGLI